MKVKKILALLFSICFLFTTIGCGNNKKSSGKTTVSFWGYTKETEEAELLKKCINEFEKVNDKVKINFVARDYSTSPQQLKTKTGPDMILVNDRYLKRWSKEYLMPLDNFISDYNSETGINLYDINLNAMNMYRYNANNGTQDQNSSQYCLPRDLSPTSLFYNASAMKSAGVKIISVDEKDMDDFNSNLIKDNTGKKKSDYGITINLPKKGYYRENPYFKGDSSWNQPTNELLVFNNRIPMSWDEIEDLGMLLTKDYNQRSLTQWGYFTEWWFNYGWSVGGDCLTDISGNGDWRFSLSDSLPNYIVEEDSYIGNNSQKTYHKNETLSLLDKISLSENQEITMDNSGKYIINGEEAQISSKIKEDVNNKKLVELPSTLEAFTRFINLSVNKADNGNLSQGGLDITPTPGDVGALLGIGNFMNGNIAMLVEQSYRITNLISTIGNSFDWDVAPLPVYKEYSIDDDVTVVKKGKYAGHAGSSGYGIINDTDEKTAKAAFEFMSFMAGPEGQKIYASDGYTVPMFSGEYNGFDYSKKYSEAYLNNDKITKDSLKNIKVFVEACSYEAPADWWYMPSDDWISIWSQKLNSNSYGVRNGTMTMGEFFSLTIKDTNNRLKQIIKTYKK